MRVTLRTKRIKATKFNCNRCNEPIIAGEKYYEWKHNHSPVSRRHVQHGAPKQSELCTGKMSGVYAATGRFTIDAFADGHVAVSTLTSIEGGGSAHDRKVRARQELRGEAPERKWSREDRKIFRNGVTAPSQFSDGRIELLPFGSPSIATAAAENAQIARRFASDATDLVTAIEVCSSSFNVLPSPKLCQVFLRYEDGTVEEL